jgi:hypothetical protein
MLAFFFDLVYNVLTYPTKIPLTFVTMSSESNQNPCIEMALSSIGKREAMKQVKEAISFADNKILYAIGFINKWPAQAKVSLEEKKESLEILVSVKTFALNWCQAWSSAQDAIWKVVQVIHSSTLMMDENEERDSWTEFGRLAERAYEYWSSANSRVEKLTKAATDSEEKWRSTITVETPATSASLNSVADAPKANTILQPLPKMHLRVDPHVKIHVPTYLSLGNGNNYLDFTYLQKRYTPAEVEALKAVEHAINLALYIGNWCHNLTDLDVHFSLARWTKVRAWLLDLETQLSPPSDAQTE